MHYPGRGRAWMSPGNTEWATPWITPFRRRWIHGSTALHGLLFTSTPLSSVCMHQPWPPHLRQKNLGITMRHRQRGANNRPGRLQCQSRCWSWLLAILPWKIWCGEKWIKLVNVCSSFALSATCASLTQTSRQNPNARFPGGIYVRSIGTSWYWSSPSAPSVLLIHYSQSADCDTDHALVCCRVRMKLKQFHRARQQRKSANLHEQDA